MVVPPAARAVPPVILAVIVGTDQWYVTEAPVIVVFNVMLPVLQLHISAGFGVAVTLAVGFTVTSKLTVVPSQVGLLGPCGVITYLTTPGEVPLLLKVLVIVDPHPLAQSLSPVIVPPVGEVNIDEVHVKLVPVTFDEMV